MERVIKFRAWDARNGEWLLGYELPKLGGFDMKGECMLFGEYTRVLSDFALQDFDKLILMQFTGLHDKNGNEIYEGDIIYSEWSRNKYVVVFKKGSFRGEQIPESMAWVAPHDLHRYAVIGNIHENPELLNQ